MPKFQGTIVEQITQCRVAWVEAEDAKRARFLLRRGGAVVTESAPFGVTTVGRRLSRGPTDITEVARCEACTHLVVEPPDSDQPDGSVRCGRGHWEGGPPRKPGEPDPWKHCKDFSHE